MKILVLCQFGMNRSKHLAGYLSGKGYDTSYGGVREDRGLLQDKIDDSDVIVTVHPSVAKALRADSNIGERRVIELDVEDREGNDWMNYQTNGVYQKLVAAMDEYLPIVPTRTLDEK
jgi:hypothetical protein